VLDTQERLQSKLADRYQIERELGRGGMATVFLAKDVRHDREVAIKVLHPELSASIGADRFEREIKLSARLQHPHILGLIDSGQADGLLYYVMPFVKGESLRDRLEREGQLPIEDAVQITLEVADALGHAHSMGIIHRDIKPENILLSGGHALVADFGIARAATEAGAQKLTQTGMAVGTPVYMAPEQSVGDTIGPTADLYSLGCVLYEMLAGEPPFTAKNPQALMARHAMEAVPSVRIVRNTVPQEVEDTIFAAMAKVPADRPQSAAQFAELLGAPLGATASMRATLRHTAARRVPTAAVRAYEPAGPAWWRRPWVVGAVVLVLAGGSLAGYQLFARPRAGAASPEELARVRRIAVLYFQNPDKDPELDPVAGGLTEALIRSLKQAGITVRSANSVAPYRGTTVGKDSIARALDVGTLIEGSITAEGKNRVKVTTWLEDAFGNDLGKRANFVISRDSLFAAEDGVARSASVVLRELVGTSIEASESRSRARNVAAWTLYQRAEKTRKDAEQAARSDPRQAAALLVQADSLLDQAEGADAEWIDPIVLRGQVALQRSQIETEKPEKAKWIDAGKRYAEQALQLDPKDANALALRGTLRYWEWRLARTSDAAARAELLKSADRDLQDAVLADGKLATAFAILSQVNYEEQDVTSALKNARSAYEADQYLRNADFILNRLFWTHYDFNLFQDAEKYCLEAGTRFPADYRFTGCRLWLQLIPQGSPDIQEAWRLARRLDSLVPKTPDGQLQSHLARMIVGGVIGKVARGIGPRATGPLADSARRVLERARGDAQVDPSQELAGYEAVMRTQMGEYDEAIGLLKRYVALNKDHSFRVGANVHWWWTPLMNIPEFHRVMSQGH
jgi:serine/threonine-protein kinase